MDKYFGLNIEFNKNNFKNKFEILANENSPSYVCVIDTNVLAYSFKDNNFRNLLNASNLNTCDGSLITLILRFIHKRAFHTYTGPEIFSDYILKPYRHLLLGNTPDVYNKVLNISINKGAFRDNIIHLDLPFKKLEDFNYLEIANKITEIDPHFIWVSLGAPKQEEFMYIIKPMIKKGVMVGVGAAFSFYTGDYKRSNIYISSLNLTWVNRLYSEPKKQFKRLLFIIKYIPKFIIFEYRSQKINK